MVEYDLIISSATQFITHSIIKALVVELFDPAMEETLVKGEREEERDRERRECLGLTAPPPVVSALEVELKHFEAKLPVPIYFSIPFETEATEGSFDILAKHFPSVVRIELTFGLAFLSNFILYFDSYFDMILNRDSLGIE